MAISQLSNAGKWMAVQLYTLESNLLLVKLMYI